MQNKISLIMITKNSETLLGKSLESVQDLVDEIVIVDSNSTDDTIKIAKKFKAQIYNLNEENLGKKRLFALNKAKGEWILTLDADEIISKELLEEIQTLINGIASATPRNDVMGYKIPFQNHFLGKPINHGGENYKMLRLFKKESAIISPNLVHERYEVKKGKTGLLKNKIYHYSYSSLTQVFKKFTDYAIRDALQKYENKEKVNLQKIFLYPPHMFYARFIKDRGYKDGALRILLDLGFAYMEFVTYIVLILLYYKHPGTATKTPPGCPGMQK